MYHHHIADMTKLLLASASDAPGLTGARIEGVLKDYWADRVAITWGADDIHSVANQCGRVLTAEQAREVMATIERKHDAEYGVNWSVIRTWVEDAGREMTPAEREAFALDDGALVIG